MECSNCGKDMFGRSDKKFCTPDCRNEYNNARYREEHKSMIEINKILKKNRMILKRLNPDGKIVVPSEIILKAGFDLEFFTNVYTTKTGREYRYCYDYGYHYDQEKDSYLLVEKIEFE